MNTQTARSGGPCSLTASVCALALGSALFCVQGIAQQSTQSTPPAGSSVSASTNAYNLGNLEVLSDTQGVDFGPYLTKVVDAVRRNWYTFIPEEARAPEMKRGKLAIEFVILPDGKVAAMRVAAPSGDVQLDRAAWGGITASTPFAPLPDEFHGPYLALKFLFHYNPQKTDLPELNKTEPH